jgi:hypothetical protein
MVNAGESDWTLLETRPAPAADRQPSKAGGDFRGVGGLESGIERLTCSTVVHEQSVMGVSDFNRPDGVPRWLRSRGMVRVTGRRWRRIAWQPCSGTIAKGLMRRTNR